MIHRLTLVALVTAVAALFFLLDVGVIGAADPPLTFVEVNKDGVGGANELDNVKAVAVSVDGKNVYAASGIDNALTVFSRNASTGALTFVEVHKDGVGPIDGLWGAISVSVSPDDKHLYVAGVNDNALTVFSRNASTGALTFVEVLKNGVGTVAFIVGINSVEVSSDGKHVYTAAANDSAVVVFSRNATDGKLTWVEAQRDNLGGVDGLQSVRRLTVSPDGKHVYASGIAEDKIAVFSRNATDGKLTWLEIQQDGTGSVDGLDGAVGVTVSPDGKHVYVTGVLEHAVAVFSRNATTGALTFVEVLKDGGVDAASNTVGGIVGAFPVKVSFDGKWVYVGGNTGDEIAVFSRNATTGALTRIHRRTRMDGVRKAEGG